MKKKILSLSPLGTDILKGLLGMAGYAKPEEVEFIRVYDKNEDEIAGLAGEAHIIIADQTFNRHITAKIAAAAKNVRLIQNLSVGYQHIDVKACTEAGIKVANTAGANTISVAEHTLAMALALMKNFFYAHRETAAGKWLQMEVGGNELHGKTWGIVGFGAIGMALAERLIPFGVTLLYHNTVKKDDRIESDLKASFAVLDELLKRSDIVSLHCPLTDATRKLIGARELALMKKTGYIINVARGEVVDEKALSTALADKTIAGAGIDVYSKEPVTADNPLLHLKDVNLILTPHSAGTALEARKRIVQMAFGNISRVLDGGEPMNTVN